MLFMKGKVIWENNWKIIISGNIGLLLHDQILTNGWSYNCGIFTVHRNRLWIYLSSHYHGANSNCSMHNRRWSHAHQYFSHVFTKCCIAMYSWKDSVFVLIHTTWTQNLHDWYFVLCLLLIFWNKRNIAGSCLFSL